jgi:lipoyl(octanoyl) transferase
VDDAKIAALGLRVRRGCCFHGLAFNVDLDLEPYSRINPCGFQGLAVTRLADLAPAACAGIAERLVKGLAGEFGYNERLENAPAHLPGGKD